MPSAMDSSPDSSPSHSPTRGVAYTFMLEHVFRYPGSYDVAEIPLRDMYRLNAVPQSFAPLPPPKDVRPKTPNERRDATHVATAKFTSSLINHVSKLPSQPCSLPPSFVTNFLLRCFPLELGAADFQQALIALDYLKDLEMRRRRQTATALATLGVEKESLHSDIERVSKKSSGITVWIESLANVENRVGALYVQINIGLRRWILINELSIEPFDARNCHAMLNTLYPPATPQGGDTPTTSSQFVLSPEMSQHQRNTFFKWIREVELHGPKCLDRLKAPDKKHPHDENNWAAVHECLDAYLKVTNYILDEVSSIHGQEDFDDNGPRTWNKGDFQTTPQTQTTPHDNLVKVKTLPPLPMETLEPGPTQFVDKSPRTQPHPLDKPTPPTPTMGSPHNDKHVSGLEKIARELRKFKRTRKSAGGENADFKEDPSPPDLHDNSDEHEERHSSSRHRSTQPQSSAPQNSAPQNSAPKSSTPQSNQQDSTGQGHGQSQSHSQSHGHGQSASAPSKPNEARDSTLPKSVLDRALPSPPHDESPLQEQPGAEADFFETDADLKSKTGSGFFKRPFSRARGRSTPTPVPQSDVQVGRPPSRAGQGSRLGFRSTPTTTNVLRKSPNPPQKTLSAPVTARVTPSQSRAHSPPRVASPPPQVPPKEPSAVAVRKLKSYSDVPGRQSPFDALGLSYVDGSREPTTPEKRPVSSPHNTRITSTARPSFSPMAAFTEEDMQTLRSFWEHKPRDTTAAPLAEQPQQQQWDWNSGACGNISSLNAHVAPEVDGAMIGMAQ